MLFVVVCCCLMLFVVVCCCLMLFDVVCCCLLSFHYFCSFFLFFSVTFLVILVVFFPKRMRLGLLSQTQSLRRHLRLDCGGLPPPMVVKSCIRIP